MYINKLIIDSGACYYIMCLMDYLRYFPKLQLIPTEKKLSVITGNNLKVIGKICVAGL